MQTMTGAKIAARSGCSPAEFLAWEREQAERHEYFRGEVFAMAGGSPRHNALCSSVNAALHGALRPRGCQVFSSDQRVGLGSGERYVYPDVTVVRGKVVLEPGTRDVIAEPTIVVEVLCASTEQYDRGLKWEGYQRIASLADYLLVSQDEARIEHFQRSESGSWIYRSLGLGESVTLANGAALSVDAVFAGNMEVPGD
jgi:Uma2 family endonuclease